MFGPLALCTGLGDGRDKGPASEAALREWAGTWAPAHNLAWAVEPPSSTGVSPRRRRRVPRCIQARRQTHRPDHASTDV